MLRPQIDLPHGHTFLIADNSLATRWQVMADVRRSGCREWRAEFAKADIPAGLKDGFVGRSGQSVIEGNIAISGVPFIESENGTCVPKMTLLFLP